MTRVHFGNMESRVRVRYRALLAMLAKRIAALCVFVPIPKLRLRRVLKLFAAANKRPRLPPSNSAFGAYDLAPLVFGYLRAALRAEYRSGKRKVSLAIFGLIPFDLLEKIE